MALLGRRRKCGRLRGRVGKHLHNSRRNGDLKQLHNILGKQIHFVRIKIISKIKLVWINTYKHLIFFLREGGEGGVISLEVKRYR